MTRSGLAALILLIAVGTPVSAQRDVARRQYTFLERNLTIEVVSENSGTLRVMRGEAGILEVAGHAADGFTGFALGGRSEDELRLTAIGAESAEYLVIVPEGVRVRIRLPDRQHIETAGRPVATFNWKVQPQDSRDADAAPGPLGALGIATPDDMFLSHYSNAVPRSFSVPDLDNFNRLDVRFAGSDFRLSTSRAVTVQPGRSDAIEFRAVQPGLSAVISLPTDTRDFRLMLAGKLALEVVGGEVRSYCDLDAQSSLGTRTYSYLPGEALVCR